MKAFPTNIDTSTGGDGFRTDYGMDLRDYFAAKAIQAFMSWDLNAPLDKQKGVDWAAEYAYKVADAMMRAREPK